jgi:hypothetical protein
LNIQWRVTKLTLNPPEPGRPPGGHGVGLLTVTQAHSPILAPRVECPIGRSLNTVVTTLTTAGRRASGATKSYGRQTAPVDWHPGGSRTGQEGWLPWQ